MDDSTSEPNGRDTLHLAPRTWAKPFTQNSTPTDRASAGDDFDTDNLAEQLDDHRVSYGTNWPPGRTHCGSAARVLPRVLSSRLFGQPSRGDHRTSLIRNACTPRPRH